MMKIAAQSIYGEAISFFEKEVLFIVSPPLRSDPKAFQAHR